MYIEDALATQGMYVGTTVGVSMRPMLRNRRDTIIVEPLRGRRLRRFEVPLYRRGSAYVLHRCVEVHPDSYTMLGDNCLNKEQNIPDERVVGVLTGFSTAHTCALGTRCTRCVAAPCACGRWRAA